MADPPPSIERHLQTGIQVILVALIIWSGTAMLDVRDKVARLEENVRTMQRDLSAATTDRYTATQATRDLSNLGKRLDLLERSQEDQNEWIRSLRDRIIAVESDLRQHGVQRRNDIPPPSRSR